MNWDIRLKRSSYASTGVCGITAFGDDRLVCWGNLHRARNTDPTTPSALEGQPTRATSLGGDWARGRFVLDGRLHRFGDNGGTVADFEFYSARDRTLAEPTTLVRLLTRASSYWCVEHGDGATICSDRNDLPASVPLP